MRVFPFYQVDAFTPHPLKGNPCAIFFDTDGLDDTTMLSIAREMNLSESAFVRHSEVSDFAVRFFTPAEEIPMAGHPTIATVRALLDSGRLVLSSQHNLITLELPIGPIKVEIHRENAGSTKITMIQKKPAFMATYNPAEILPVFGLEIQDALAGFPIQTVSTGTPQLMLPLRDHSALQRAHVNIPALFDLRKRADFFSPHLFCLGGLSPEGTTFARHFGVPPDTPEDPFTGSATGGMAAYLWHYGLLSQPVFIAEQGHWMGRPGQAVVELEGSPDQIQAVRVSGQAVTVLRGELSLP